MEVQQISWKNGFVHRGIDPSEAYKCTEVLRAAGGGKLTPAAVVAEAKKKSSPIHSLFEWDDSVAAKRFRVKQAGELISGLRVVYEESPEIETRAYEIETRAPVGKPDLQGRETFYSTMDEILRDPEKRDALLIEAIRQLTAWRRKFAGITELQKVVESIDAAIVEIGSTEPVGA